MPFAPDRLPFTRSGVLKAHLAAPSVARNRCVTFPCSRRSSDFWCSSGQQTLRTPVTACRYGRAVAPVPALLHLCLSPCSLSFRFSCSSQPWKAYSAQRKRSACSSTFPVSVVCTSANSLQCACNITLRGETGLDLICGSCQTHVETFWAGTDGTGNAISPQLPGLLDAGFDVRSAARMQRLHITARRIAVVIVLQTDDVAIPL